ncbi:MAG: ribosome small subunit-dependent GTPase A [Deltaproteobacteria bacterium]|nr:ribosome small subunit-dependent GTPase A [Deltaproteobacteria bacterium]
MAESVQARGMISAVFADRCLVYSDDGDYVCALRGRMKGRGKPVVGDNVLFEPHDDGSGRVVRLLERQSELLRGQSDRKRSGRVNPPQVLAANVDQVVIVSSVASPPFREGLIDRFWMAARQAGVGALLCVNKMDLDPAGVERARAIFAPLGLKVLGVSSIGGQGLEELSREITERVSVLVGHSGVGKTSLLNALGGHDMTVGEVDDRLGRGRHTTTTARLIRLQCGGFAIDSPGIREFGLHGLAPGELADLYPDFQPFLGRCGFRDCVHREEPRCSVRQALEQGELSLERYQGYLKLLEEAEEARAALQPG